MNFSKIHYDIPKIFFNIIFIILITICCYLIIQPFIWGFICASIIVISTWNFFIKLQGFLWNNRTLAVILMTLLLLLVCVFPISMLINSIINNSTSLISWATHTDRLVPPKLSGLHNIPLIGNKLYCSWQSLISSDYITLLSKIQPYVGKSIRWLLGQVANLGSILINCGLMILFSTMLYSRGEQIGLMLIKFIVRVNPTYGYKSVILGIQTIRTVAYGVILTSIIQTFLSGIGLIISGIPLASLLIIGIFVLCLFQLGPLLILIPSIIWFYGNGNNIYGTILLVWSCIITMLDNILRPILIYISSDLPIILVLCGIIGGIITFGIIGLFVGPVTLVISWYLLLNWIKVKSTLNNIKSF